MTDQIHELLRGEV